PIHCALPAIGSIYRHRHGSGVCDRQIDRHQPGDRPNGPADVKLSFSTVATAVEVSANVVELQTESATVQNAVEEKLIEAIPNVTRNPFYYALVQPGAAPRATMNDTQSARSFGIGESSRRQFRRSARSACRSWWRAGQ